MTCEQPSNTIKQPEGTQANQPSIICANTVLTEGQWSALLYQVPDQVKPLAVKLAIHHGHLQPPRDGEPCALCGKVAA